MLIACTVLFALGGIFVLNFWVWYLPEARLGCGIAGAVFAGLIAGLIARFPK